MSNITFIRVVQPAWRMADSPDTHVVGESAPGEVLWRAFLTDEQYHRFMRKWHEAGDASEAIKAIHQAAEQQEAAI